MPPCFPLGRIVSAPGALEALQAAQQEPKEFLSRHVKCDWGEVSEADKKENDFSVDLELRILSAYTLKTGVKIWVLPEADRSATTFLLPSEY